MKRDQLKIHANEIALSKSIDINNYFDKIGRKSCFLGRENGNFEFWCYPIKVCRDFSLSFLLNSSSVPIESSDIAKNISVSPERTILTYCYQSFTVKEIIITPIEEPAGIILLDVDTIEPIKIIVSFLPELQPMWPAGLGGQACFWSSESRSFILSESQKKYNYFIGSPSAQNLNNPPAHSFSEFPNQFAVNISLENCKDEIFVIGLAGGQMEREKAKTIYENIINDPMKYYNQCFDHYVELHKNTMSIKTPDEKINLAYEWGKVTFDNMVIDNPFLGKGLVAGWGCAGKSGRPGFGWFFGGDAFLNSFAMSGYGEFGTVKDALRFVQQFQREDGKIAHEVSQSANSIDWFHEYPYAYLHADTSCFYIIAMYEYLITSGDINFIEQSWESIFRAFQWCLSTDENQDGLMDNPKAGLGAYEIPPFTKTRTDIYLAASFTMCLFCMKEISFSIGQKINYISQQFEKALSALNEKFWDSENEIFSFAFDDENKKYNEITPLPAIPMIWNLLDKRKAKKTFEKINSAELQTDWGTRSISEKSKYFDPLNYNYGAVWPFMTTFSSLANYRYQNPLQGYSMMKNIVEHALDNAIGCCHEVFSGYTNRHLEESVPHQAFSTLGYMLPLIKGTIGLEGNALKKEIYFYPQLPGNWEFLEINNYKIGISSFNFIIEKGINLSQEQDTNKNEVIAIHVDNINGDAYKVIIKMSFPLTSEIINVKLGDRNCKYSFEESGNFLTLLTEILNLKNGTLLIEYRPSYEILPYENFPEIGSTNQGLKIIKEMNFNGQKTLVVEGLSGQKYFLEIIQNDQISKIEGAELIEGGILIDFPNSAKGEFVRKEIKISA